MRSIPRLTALSLCSLAVSPLWATETDTLVVTASRHAETIDQTLVPVRVITREEIDTLPAGNIQELLATTTGMDITTNGGHGKNSSLFLRGTASDHVLILVDGVKMGSATSGRAAVEQIPLSQIERIEVVRGPRSSLYGSEAIGGVIQIFTRRGADELTPTLSLKAGNQDTREVNASLRGGNDRHRFNLTLGHFETNGVDVLSTAASDPDKDGYRNDSISAGLDSQLSDQLKLSLNLLETRGHNDFDNKNTDKQRSSEDRQQVLGAKLVYQASQALDLSAQLSQSRDESDDITDGVKGSRFNTRRRTLDLQGDYYLSDSHTLTLGAGAEEERVDSTQSFTQNSREQYALYGQWQGRWQQLDLLLGLRTDDYEAFGRHNTGNLNLGYRLGEGRKLLLSYGEGFHVPTFNDLYFPFTDYGFGFTFEGNPDLKPEESKSYELGFEQRRDNQYWAVRLFRTKIDNLIQFSVNTMENLDSALIKGVELEWAGELDQWNLRASATFLDATDDSTGKVLRRRAEKTMQLDLSRNYGPWTAGISLLAQSHRYNDADNDERLPGYGVANLKLRYRIDSDWSLTARVNDLFDRDFVTAAYSGGSPVYNTPGRTFLFGIDYGI